MSTTENRANMVAALANERKGFCSFSLASGRSSHAARADELDPTLESAFAFNRLSIQDLSPAGHQPMVNSRGDRILVFNGELYDAGEHRTALQREGVNFRGHS